MSNCDTVQSHWMEIDDAANNFFLLLKLWLGWCLRPCNQELVAKLAGIYAVLSLCLPSWHDAVCVVRAPLGVFPIITLLRQRLLQ